MIRRYTTQFSVTTAPPPLATVADESQVWALDPQDGAVLVLNADDTLVGTVQLHPGLTGIAVQTPWAWVSSNDGRVYQISLYDRTVKRIYDLHHATQGIAVASNHVWVALGR